MKHTSHIYFLDDIIFFLVNKQPSQENLKWSYSTELWPSAANLPLPGAVCSQESQKDGGLSPESISSTKHI